MNPAAPVRKIVLLFDIDLNYVKKAKNATYTVKKFSVDFWWDEIVRYICPLNKWEYYAEKCSENVNHTQSRFD